MHRGASRIHPWAVATGALAAVLILAHSSSRAETADLDWHTDLRKAAQESQQTRKPLLIEISAVWCGYCKKMKETYSDEKIVKHVNGCFVPVSVDADKHKRLVETIGADALPTTVIISPDFKLLKRITGYRTPEQLNRQLGEICQVNHESVQPPTPGVPARPVKAVTPEVGFGGHCLVTLLEKRRIRQGKARYSTTHKGLTLRFSSEENMRRFETNPAEYWPAVDGDCPVARVDQSRKVKGKPKWGAVYRGRLWFFADRESRAKFAARPSQYAAAAQE